MVATNKPPAGLLTVEGLLTPEKLRGALASVISGSASSAGILFGTIALGLSAPVSLVLFGYLLGSVLGYSLDILIAKQYFGTTSPVAVPYGDLYTRGKWLVKSFAHRHFFRFIVTVVIETLTTLAMLGAVVRAMDAHGILAGWGLRDAVTAVAVAFVNFWMFGNVLRFDWAYRETENPVLNVVVLLWMTLSMLVFAATYDAGASTASTASGAQSTMHL